MPTLQQFLNAINAVPDNVALRLQFADWLEEQGDPLCDEWRKGVTLEIFRTDHFASVAPSVDDAGYGYCDGSGDGSGHGVGHRRSNIASSGDGYSFGNGFDGYGYRNTFVDGLGDGYGFGFGNGAGDGFGDGFPNGIGYGHASRSA